MQDIFIEKIHIKKVRHLEDIEIPLSSSERKHLILTGQNGSGKTSVLEALKENLKAIEDKILFQIPEWKRQVEHNKSIIFSLRKKNNKTSKDLNTLQQNEHVFKFNLDRITKYEGKLITKFNQIENINNQYQNGQFILAAFDAKRLNHNKEVKGITKIKLQNSYKLDQSAGIDFLPYIVSLKAEKSFARDDKDFETVKKIENWFSSFEEFLREIFSDSTLKLVFDRKEFNFNLVQGGRKKFDFHTLSDGYSAVLKIITELIFRMEKNKAKIYDVQGIVLIDELETHLHVELQKKILPLLTQFFPKIQFIITTHSPFVLNSIENAVVYDLENRILVEDMTRYSYDGIVESYFNLDKYSASIKRKMETYERLVKKAVLTEVEEEQMIGLRYYLKEIPSELAPELKSHFLSVETNRKLKKAS